MLKVQGFDFLLFIKTFKEFEVRRIGRLKYQLDGFYYWGNSLELDLVFGLMCFQVFGKRFEYWFSQRVIMNRIF